MENDSFRRKGRLFFWKTKNLSIFAGSTPEASTLHGILRSEGITALPFKLFENWPHNDSFISRTELHWIRTSGVSREDVLALFPLKFLTHGSIYILKRYSLASCSVSIILLTLLLTLKACLCNLTLYSESMSLSLLCRFMVRSIVARWKIFFCTAPPFPSLLSCFPTLSYIAATIFYTSSALHALSPSDASVSPEKN